jgi:hypothetical protein
MLVVMTKTMITLVVVVMKKIIILLVVVMSSMTKTSINTKSQLLTCAS